jgi:hypothetical protein
VLVFCRADEHQLVIHICKFKKQKCTNMHDQLRNQEVRWQSGQRGAPACRRSRVRILEVAANQLSVLIFLFLLYAHRHRSILGAAGHIILTPAILICCWLRKVAVREHSLWLPVCCVTRVTHSALSA